ncbi:MAG TPA: hypothetical protein VMG35_05105 [Bryobacteraceae bacterium]|nr:hypothetical protein [Bryobacteraceae bacterium]
MRAGAAIALALWLASLAAAQPALPKVVLEDAPEIRLPGVEVPERKLLHEADSNSPVYWDGSTVYVINSYSHPWRSFGPDLLHLSGRAQVKFGGLDDNLDLWIEAAWKDNDGTLYGAFHYEPDMICFSNRHLPTMPRIGWLRSHDNGATWEDLGFVIEAKACAVKCDTASPWDAGGTGDFVFVPDEHREYVYFFGTSYDPNPRQQGVFAARMRYADRDNPSGRVWKWHAGGWTEPGLGGRVTPVFASERDYHRADGAMFWGPAVHWNTHLGMYVMLLNHAVDTRLTADGIYISFNGSLDDPGGWSKPVMILDRTGIQNIMQGAGLSQTKMDNGWYPQAIGLSRGETDKSLGRTGRFFMAGVSKKTITFLKPGESQ